MNRPIVYKFARSENVSTEVGAPNVALMNITGEANCVRYLDAPPKYGWRVIGDASGQATAVIPTRGRTTVKIFPVSHSGNIARAVITLAFQLDNHDIGKMCSPRKDIQQILHYKKIDITMTQTENENGVAEVHIDN